MRLTASALTVERTREAHRYDDCPPNDHPSTTHRAQESAIQLADRRAREAGAKRGGRAWTEPRIAAPFRVRPPSPRGAWGGFVGETSEGQRLMLPLKTYRRTTDSRRVAFARAYTIARGWPWGHLLAGQIAEIGEARLAAAVCAPRPACVEGRST